MPGREFPHKKWRILVEADSEGFNLIGERKDQTGYPSFKYHCGPGDLKEGIETFRSQLDDAENEIDKNVKELWEVPPSGE